MTRLIVAATLLLTVVGSASAAPITIGGITFPGGVQSFADAVVTYNPGSGVGVNGSQVFNDPLAALGLPNYNGSTGAVSLGNANAGPNTGVLIVQFTDNSLTTSGNSNADLFIFEVGVDVERFFVDISQDGVNWVALGSLAGQPTAVDIDAFAGVVQGARYSFVRLRDDPAFTSQFNVTFAEADIDAGIGAISSAPPIPEPATMTLLGIGLAGAAVARRRRKAQAQV